VVLGFGVLTVGDLWLEGGDAPKGGRVGLVPTAQSGEGATGAQARGLKGVTSSDAAEDPAALAKKLQGAADNGDAEAMLQLGRDLATGNKRPKDVAQAAKWVQLAAAAGNPDGMLELGRFYRDGLGVAQNSARAYAWFSRAAAINHPGAQQERDALVRTMSEGKLKEGHQLSVPTEPVAAVVRPQ
jgi:TPR repeat protein